jgi:hypothetical protein
MNVTVRDVENHDRVIQDFTVVPHLGLPAVGHRIRLGRSPYQPSNRYARVADYEWRMADGAPVVAEVWMLVKVE